MLFLDGMYIGDGHGPTQFRWVKAPTGNELTQLTHTITQRVGRYLGRQGLLERDGENNFLTSNAMDEGLMDHLLGSSITFRIAVGARQGRKMFSLNAGNARKARGS